MRPPLIMGILNVTPDSFSDGGLYFGLEKARLHAAQLLEDGADIIDIGGESTRPGSDPVSIQEEMDRVLPVVEWVCQNLEVEVSIDTQKAAVAREALMKGATVVNDVSGGSEIALVQSVIEFGAVLIAMHCKGAPKTMQTNPQYPGGVTREVIDFFVKKQRQFTELGLPPEKLWIDPGIGFGKTSAHCLTLLNDLNDLVPYGHRIVIGTSRKSFLSRIVGKENSPIVEREPGTLASNLWARSQGASVFRVHDVPTMKRALLTWEKILDANES